MKVLVTGGAGFIGSAVCRLFMREYGCSIINVDALTYASNLEALECVSAEPSYTFVHGSINDARLIENILAEQQPDAILHLAAETHVDRSIDGPAEFLKTNVMGSFVLLDKALEYYKGLGTSRQDRFRFIHVSTDEVFGDLGPTGVFTEAYPYRPSSPYAASKAASDHFAMAWQRTYDLPVIVTYSCNNFGPYQFPEKFIPNMILKALQRKPLPIYGDGQNIRDWIFVDDHVHALAAILRSGIVGTRYCISARNELTNMNVVTEICQIVDQLTGSRTASSDLIKFVKDRPGHDFRYAMDPSYIENELDWKPKCEFKTALRLTVKWYFENKGWWQRIRKGFYIGERLGLGRRASKWKLKTLKR